MTGRRGAVGAVVVALAVIALPSGCATPVRGPSLVLRLATPDASRDGTGRQVQHFVDEVSRRSGGTIRIDPVWDTTPNGATDWDQTVARQVADGRYDLGLVPGRAWDVLGVDSLRALNTPFLVTSTPMLEAVLEQDDLRADLLSGLPEVGVVGIDLFPDALRHPFGYVSPLLGPEDYRDAVIRSATSATIGALFASWGASTTDDDPDRSTQRGAESSYALAPAGIATGNVTFFPKTDSLVAGSQVRERLRDDQWQVLREAAAQTRAWLFARQASEFEDAAAFCDRGGHIVAATAAQVRSLEEASGTVTASLRRDGPTRHLIDEIAALGQGLPPPAPVTSCPGTSPAPASTDLDGTFTAHVSRRDLRSAGVTDEGVIAENVGHFTWTMDAGRWTYHQTADHFIAHPDDTGSYTWTGGILTIHWTVLPLDYSTVRVHVTRDGSLVFRDAADADSRAIPGLTVGSFAGGWTRVADLKD